jgi:hypothetical protein
MNQDRDERDQVMMSSWPAPIVGAWLSVTTRCAAPPLPSLLANKSPLLVSQQRRSPVVVNFSVLLAVKSCATSAAVISCGVDVAPPRPRLNPLLKTSSLVADALKSSMTFLPAEF